MERENDAHAIIVAPLDDIAGEAETATEPEAEATGEIAGASANAADLAAVEAARDAAVLRERSEGEWRSTLEQNHREMLAAQTALNNRLSSLEATIAEQNAAETARATLSDISSREAAAEQELEVVRAPAPESESRGDRRAAQTSGRTRLFRARKS